MSAHALALSLHGNAGARAALQLLLLILCAGTGKTYVSNWLQKALFAPGLHSACLVHELNAFFQACFTGTCSTQLSFPTIPRCAAALVNSAYCSIASCFVIPLQAVMYKEFIGSTIRKSTF